MTKDAQKKKIAENEGKTYEYEPNQEDEIDKRFAEVYK